MPYSVTDVPLSHFDGFRNLTKASGTGPNLAEVTRDLITRAAEQEGAMHDPVATVAALRAVTDYADKMTIFCEAKGLYYYESTSASADDGDLVVKPTDNTGNGRWLLMQRLSPNHETQHATGAADALSDIPGAATIAGGADTIATHGPRHDEGAADELADLPAAAVLGGTAVTVAGTATEIPLSEAARVALGTAPTLTVNAEVADVIAVDFQAPVPSVEEYMAVLVPDADMEVNTAAFRLAETGAGAEVSPTAMGRLIFTTDAGGAAQISATDVAGASGETCYLMIRPMFISADIAQQCAPVMTAVTFD